MIQVANPYLVGFLSNMVIEVRNIFNPNKIVQKIEIAAKAEFQFVSACVAQNINMKPHQKLDDFYGIIKYEEIDDKLKSTEVFKLMKFKQDEPAQ